MQPTAPAHGPSPADSGLDIADLRRRCNHRRRWFRICFALVPLGCLLAMTCLVGALGAAGPILALLGLLMLCVGAGGMMLVGSDWQRDRRALAMAEVAERLGFRFIQSPEQHDYAPLLGLQFFRRATTCQVRNLIVGRWEARTVLAMDCSVSLGFGSSAVGFVQTVILVSDIAPGLPEFAIYPRGMLERFSFHLEGLRVELPDEQSFTDLYSVRGDDAETVRGCLTATVLELCREAKNLTVVAGGGQLAVFRQNRLLPPGEWLQRIEEALRLAEALRASAAA